MLNTEVEQDRQDKRGYFMQVLITTNLFHLVSRAYHTYQVIFVSDVNVQET